MTYASCVRIRASCFTPPSSLYSTAMSSAQPPNQPPEQNDNNGEQKPEIEASSSAPAAAENGNKMDTAPDQPPEETWEDIPEEIRSLSTEEVATRARLIENDLRVGLLQFKDPSFTDEHAGNPLGNPATATRTNWYEGED